MRFLRNDKALSRILTAARRAFAEAAEDVRTDLMAGGTMPFESGFLQNEATTVDFSLEGRGEIAIVSDTVYARRKYFNPQFEFDRRVNSQAGGRWFDTYINGEKRGFLRDRFAERIGGEVR